MQLVWRLSRAVCFLVLSWILTWNLWIWTRTGWTNKPNQRCSAHAWASISLAWKNSGQRFRYPSDVNKTVLLRYLGCCLWLLKILPSPWLRASLSNSNSEISGLVPVHQTFADMWSRLHMNRLNHCSEEAYSFIISASVTNNLGLIYSSLEAWGMKLHILAVIWTVTLEYIPHLCSF